MTKIDGRDKNTAARQIEQSLGRQQTDVIDLLQFHEVIRLDDPERYIRRGAVPWKLFRKQNKLAKCATSASQAIRIPAYTCGCLKQQTRTRFHFDTVQMPINVMDAHFRSFS